MIEVRNLTKSYTLGSSRHYVFKDVSFTFPEKTNVGILGPNGAGKSTLLRILGGIDHPDSGEIKTDVSISWPLGLKGGFVGHMTGRENCRMICNAYGIKTGEIPKKLEYIKNLSGIGPYFEQPVAYYSSGMGGRLGFAMSMAFDFDYFLIDEITSVGDGHFKNLAKEALDKKRSVSNIIMVSHSMGDLKRFCDVAVFIRNGEVTVFEDWDQAIEAYLPKSEAKTSVTALKKVAAPKPVVEEKKENPTVRLLSEVVPTFKDVDFVKGAIGGNTAAGLMQISNAFMRLDQHWLAYHYVCASFEEDPYVVAVCQRKAVLEGFLGKNSEKLATLEHGLRLDCNHAGLNVEKARVLNDMGRSDEAIKAAEIALSVEPKDVRSWIALANAQFRLEQYEACVETCRSGIDQTKDSKGPLGALLTQASFGAGDLVASLDQFLERPNPKMRKENLEFALRILEDYQFSLSQHV
ncbi:MAG: ATP-binding cassette domain-containing protein [Opitutales bacterium]|nr:ATP-binding cassette domain-containing protein [Opitutales bacterium]